MLVISCYHLHYISNKQSFPQLNKYIYQKKKKKNIFYINAY